MIDVQLICGFVFEYAKTGFSGVRPSSNLSTIFKYLKKNAWPIKAKFHVEPPSEGGTKACFDSPGHMTKMASTLVNGKNLHKSSPEPEVL